MASIAHALARIKDDVRAFVSDEAVRVACREAGHQWRERKFGPVRTVHLFVLQVLHFNTAIRHLRHLAGHAVNAMQLDNLLWSRGQRPEYKRARPRHRARSIFY